MLQQQQQQQHVVAPASWKWTLWLELFGVFLLKFDAHVVVAVAVVVVSCRPLLQHPKPKAKPNLSSGTHPALLPPPSLCSCTHTLAAYLNKFICNLVFAVCEHFPHFEWSEKGRMSGRWAWLCGFVCLCHIVKWREN